MSNDEMDKNQFANWIIGKYGNSAIVYCTGRMHGNTDIIDTFKENGSHALLNDWEDEINSSANRWKEIIEVIKTKQK